MTRALHCCRWCAAPPAPSTDPQGRGRPPTFCCDDHRALYRSTFGQGRYDGPVELVERCGACRMDGVSVSFPGPVRAPGRLAAAATTAATSLHGHPVQIQVRPVSHAEPVGGFTVEMAGHRSAQEAGL